VAVHGKTIIHPDGTKTESVTDPNTRQLEQKTLDVNGVLILRRLYQLNERGLPVMGNIYDGSGQPVARSQSFFDSFGRLQEERLSNLNGEVFQRLLHEYDNKGQPKQPKVINYKVSMPTMRPALMDFTRYQQDAAAPAEGGQPAAAGSRGNVRAPVDLDAAQGGAPATSGGGAGSGEGGQDEKGGFFKRLFKRK
jgi:hypothetical protein